jgi:type I restriction enzyme, S subunit
VTCALSAYPAMRGSEQGLLGPIPEHWATRRLRHVAELRVSNVDKKTAHGESPVRLCNYVDVYKNDVIRMSMPFMRASASRDEINRYRLRTEDVVITKDSEEWGDIGVPAWVSEEVDDVICGYHLAILRPDPDVMLGRYLFWQLLAQSARVQFSVAAKGVTRYGLSHGAIKQVTVLVPPIPEQVAIVRFLNHADLRIRRYVHAKRTLIKLLDEHRQAIIQKAVTRGVDASAHLKSSSLPWLGDMPEHWEIRRNGRLFAQRNETGYASLPILEVSLQTGVRLREFSNSARKQVMSDRGKYKRALKGDIAYNMMRMWQGAVGVVPADGLVSPAYIVARPFGDVDTRYFNYLFRTAAYKSEIDARSRGIVKDRNRLYWEDFKQMSSPYPPIEEQARIADYIDESTRGVTSAMEQAEKEIGLFKEYRTRLIGDVVTGKLDVREAAANLVADEAGPEGPDFWGKEEEESSAEVTEETLDETTHA